ncbi:MAG: pirin family protein, partial [Actinomycetota bacterium]
MEWSSAEKEHVALLVGFDEQGLALTVKHYAPGQALGAPDHPHRGFETVTYLLDGEMEHRDSTGGGGLLRGGDTQWMTA